MVAKSGGLFECEFCGMQYDKTRIQEMVREMQAGAKVKDVTITGTLTTNYAGELACINSVYYFEGTPDETVMAGVDTFNDQITVN